MNEINLNTKIALQYILEQMFNNECKCYSGELKHPDGINFYQWLYYKDIIDTNEFEALNKA
jgi:hypothetical protein